MWSLIWRLQMIMGLNFRIVRNKSGYIFFKDAKLRTNYSLYSIGMSEEQILEIARILNKVLSQNTRDNRRQRRDVPTRSLNSPHDLSKQFVARVLNLNSSPLHKFLLLTSGAYLSSPESGDLLISLAEAKKEDCGDLRSIFMSDRIFATLQETYVLPGVTDSTAATSTGDILNAAITRHSLETIARLIVFLDNAHPNMTLSEHLRLKDNKAFSTISAIRAFGSFSLVEEFLVRKPGYSNLGNRLTARELSILGALMSGGHTRIPEDFLLSRVTSMNSASKSNKHSRLLYEYLSTTEIFQVGQVAIDEINAVMNVDYRSQRQASIVYAAIAELLVHKGKQRTLDVIHELRHISESKAITVEATEATVLLILAALKPENDEMPFSWTAQLSEHSWVLNSQISLVEKLALKV